MLPDFSSMTEGHIFLAMVFPAMAAVFFCLAWRGLRGTRRYWIYSYYLCSPASPSGIFTNWPLKAASFGILALVYWAETLLEYTGYSEFSRGPHLIVVGALPFLGAVLGHLWWPGFLGPRWYRQWRMSGDQGRVMPFTEHEIAYAKTMPEGRKKDRLLRDMEDCRHGMLALRGLSKRRRR